MTISSNDIRRVSAVMNGINTTVEVTFKFYSNTDLVVSSVDASGNETNYALTTDYTVTGGSGAVGQVVFGIAPASGRTVYVVSNVPTLQDLDLVKDNALNPTALETALDKAVVMIQDREERLDRAILSTPASGISGIVIGDKVASNLLQWSADGTTITSIDPDDVAITVTTNPVSGSEIAVTQSSHGFVVGNILYHNGTLWAKAKADSTSTAEVIGFVSAVTGVSSFTLITSGTISGLSGLTAGANYFLSAATAGAMTATEPSTVGQISLPVFIATSTTAGIVRIQRGVTVGTALTIATQAQMEAATSNTNFVTPGRQHFHPGMAKALALCDFAGTLTYGYNVTSVTDGGTGIVTVTFTTAFADTNYIVSAIPSCSAGAYRYASVVTKNVGSVVIHVSSATGTAADGATLMVAVWGDFA